MFRAIGAIALLVIVFFVTMGAMMTVEPERDPVLFPEASGYRDTVRSPAEREQLWIMEAQDSVRSRLKDAASAEFRSVAIRQYKGAPLVCGEVNAKNSFGGYGGYQKFIFAGSMGTFLDEHMQPGEMTKAWSEFCSG